MNILTEWLQTYFDEIEPMDFYRMIFPKGELDTRDSKTKGKYTAVIMEVTDKKKKAWKKDKAGRFILDENSNRIPIMDSKTGKQREVPEVKRHTVTDDLETIDKVLQGGNFCLMSPLSYAGKKRNSESARFLYAFTVDLDDIVIKKNGTPQGLIDLWNAHIMAVERIPKPTMIVSSGTGLHLYYVLETAIPLFPNVAAQLQKYKHELTRLCWNEGIVSIKSDEDIQYEGIYQGFRMPGTITKAGKLNGTNERAVAFVTGEKVSMEYLNGFVAEKYRVTEFSYKSKLSKTTAKELYPEWYERRIENGEKGILNPWHVSRRLYDWWKQQILSGARVNHRYWCLWVLAIYAKKCSMYDEKHNPNPVTREELEADAWELMDYLESLTISEDNHFTETDVLEALEAFEDSYMSYPRNSVRYKSGIMFEPQIPRRKKPMKQTVHLERARAVQNIDYPNGEWRNKEGRPKGSGTKREMVLDYMTTHIGASVSETAKALNISRTTVYKFLPELEKYKKEMPPMEFDFDKPEDIERFIHLVANMSDKARKELLQQLKKD